MNVGKTASRFDNSNSKKFLKSGKKHMKMISKFFTLILIHDLCQANSIQIRISFFFLIDFQRLVVGSVLRTAWFELQAKRNDISNRCRHCITTTIFSEDSKMIFLTFHWRNSTRKGRNVGDGFPHDKMKGSK